MNSSSVSTLSPNRGYRWFVFFPSDFYADCDRRHDGTTTCARILIIPTTRVILQYGVLPFLLRRLRIHVNLYRNAKTILARVQHADVVSKHVIIILFLFFFNVDFL